MCKPEYCKLTLKSNIGLVIFNKQEKEKLENSNSSNANRTC